MSALNIFRLLGDLVHLMSIFFLAYKIIKSRSCAGISLKSQMLYMAVYAARYLDLFVWLKFDFLHVYNAILKVFFLGSQSVILYFMLKIYRSTHDPRTDSFNNVGLLLVLPCVLLSLIFTDTSFTTTAVSSTREVALHLLLSAPLVPNTNGRAMHIRIYISSHEACSAHAVLGICCAYKNALV